MATEPLVLQTHNKPSFFNKDMLLGGLIGGLFGGVPAIIGAVIGAFLGKKRLERESEQGKMVGEPTALNKEAAIGGLLALQIGAGIVAAVVLGGVAAAAELPLLAVAGIAAAGLVAAPIAGAVIGGKVGKHRQEAEYQEAKQQTIVRHLSSHVSPEVGGAVEYAMSHDKSWAKEITEKRMLAQAQGQRVH